MALKVLATADIHIGRQSAGISGHDDRLSTRHSWGNLVRWAIDNEVDALALAGDIVDHDNRYFEAIGPLQSGFERLRKAGIEVFMVAGNHDFDVLPQLINAGQHPNVHLLGRDGRWQAQTFSKGANRIRFVGWSFNSRHVFSDPSDTWDLQGWEDDIPTIGLVHGDVDNPQSNYAPLSSVKLSDKPVDTWIVGHIHKPQTLRDREPLIFYPGSPHALSAKEPGRHSATLLTIRAKGDVEVTQVMDSPVRYEFLEIDVTHAKTAGNLRNLLHDALSGEVQKNISELQGVSWLIYDLMLTGSYPNLDEMNRCLDPVKDYDVTLESGCRVLVRNVSHKVRPAVADMQALSRQASPAGILARSILALERGESTDFLDAIIPRWKEEWRSLQNTPTYQPISGRLQEVDSNDLAKQYIFNECNKLLGVLMNQQS